MLALGYTHTWHIEHTHTHTHTFTIFYTDVWMDLGIKVLLWRHLPQQKCSKNIVQKTRHGHFKWSKLSPNLRFLVLLSNVGPANLKNFSEVCYISFRKLWIPKMCQKTVRKLSDICQKTEINIPVRKCGMKSEIMSEM